MSPRASTHWSDNSRRRVLPKLVVLEATSSFERPAAADLAASGIAVAVVNPRQARDFAKATGTLPKTDKIVTSYVLARFAEVLKPEPGLS